jgi:hypothetical protein
MTNQPSPEPSPESSPSPEASDATRRPVTLLQQRGIEAEVLIPFIRRLEQEIGKPRAHQVAREVIEEIARQQGRHVAEALGRTDVEGFTHVKDSWGGAGGDLTIETLHQDDERLEFNVVGCRFAEMYQRMGAEDLGFILSCARDFSLSEGYSADLHLERRQTIMQGAAYCDFRYRLARRPGDPESQAAESQVAESEAGERPPGA